MITNNIIILLLAIVIIILAVISYLEFKKFKIEINKLIEDHSNVNYKVNKLSEAVFANELDQNAPVIKKQSKNISKVEKKLQDIKHDNIEKNIEEVEEDHDIKEVEEVEKKDELVEVEKVEEVEEVEEVLKE